jgi:hypothetical protein
VFLVGTSTGGVALHNVNSSTAACIWPGTGTGSILAVCWSCTSPVAFAALDSASMVHWFDLSKVRHSVVGASFCLFGPIIFCGGCKKSLCTRYISN